MKSIYLKELKQFFSSPVGYLSMGLFFVFNALFLWFIQGGYYYPEYRFADLYPFFSLAPWIMIFVIAAIGMRSFSDEFKLGTIEILLTKPLSFKDLVLGKFLSIWTVIILMIIPTLVYVYSIHNLSQNQSLDYKNLLAAYTGLILLGAAMASISIFSSSLFDNQVSAFLVGLFLIVLFFYGFEGLGNFNLLGGLDLFFKKLSLDFHYQNFIKGLIKLSDVVYLISISVLFLLLTHTVLKNRIR